MSTNILSIDGGGIRGIIPAVVLKEIEVRTGRPVSEAFDVIAGTSTGGILAAGLSIPGEIGPKHSAEDVVNIYKEDGPRIFKQSGLFGWGITSSRYSIDNMKAVLIDRFGKQKMGDLETEVVLPTYDIIGRRPVVFSSEKARHSSVMDVPAWKAACATSAAPTYFEPVQFKNKAVEMSCIDGGVYCNTPAALALRESGPQAPDLGEEQINIVSIGTGSSEESINPEKSSSWGVLGWAPKLIKIAMDGSSDMAGRHLSDLESVDKLNYWRLQTPLQSASESMDDVSKSNLIGLEIDAQRLLNRRSRDIKEISDVLRRIP